MTLDHDLLQSQAATLRTLHQGPDLLLLPNIWDPLGAILLQSLGYPAVATASAALAYSRGWDDGEVITFPSLLQAVSDIAAAVDVPLTADLERGYGSSPAQVADRARQVMAAGAVGINLEDSYSEGGPLRPIEEQCRRLESVRQMAGREGIPLVINARTDVFFSLPTAREEDKVAEALSRGQAYVQAGADCVYPMGVSQRPSIQQLVAGLPCPINIYIRPGVPPLSELKAMGVRRASLGPNLLRASVEAMRQVARALATDAGYELFGDQVIASADISRMVRGRPRASNTDQD